MSRSPNARVPLLDKPRVSGNSKGFEYPLYFAVVVA